MTNAIHPTLQEWLDLENSVRARSLQAGVSSPEQLRARTGLQLIQDMLAGHIPGAPIGQALDFVLVQAQAGHVVFQGTPGPQYYNPMGTVHGGWYATLLDSAMGCAVHTMMPLGRGYTTAELSINMVKAITHKVTRVRAIGEVIHCGRQLATTQGRLVGHDGTLYAHATSTCLVFDLPTGA